MAKRPPPVRPLPKGKANNFGTQFKKGHKGTNPPSVQTMLAKAGFTKEMVNEKIANALVANRKITDELKVDASTSNFDLIIISIIEAAIRNADSSRLDNLLDKIFGKTVNVSGSISVESDQPVLPADGEIIQRALERAIKNNFT